MKRAHADRVGNIVECGLRLDVFAEIADRLFDALIVGVHSHISVAASWSVDHPDLAKGYASFDELRMTKRFDTSASFDTSG
jgi:hypothetical protein